jgi:uncharacterized protein (TIGR03435 family)
MTLLQRRLYRLLVRLHPTEFRHDSGRDMELDFEDASAHTRFATLYLDALISLGRQWLESSLSGGADRGTAQKASLLAGQYTTFGDEPLAALQLGRGLLAALMLIAYFLPSTAAAYAQTAQPTPVPLLEVATIKPSDPAKEHLGLYWRQPDGFKLEGTTLRGMIANAYSTPASVKGLVQGGPAWMAAQAFDVQVKVDPATTERWSRLPQQVVDEERRTVERDLLVERFHLKLHRELREMPAFLLTVAKGGSKLRAPVAEENLQAGVPRSRINFLGRGHWEGHSALLSNLSRSLAGQTEMDGRPVVDKTGLAGQYDFILRWAPADVPADAGEQWPSLFTALEEQLGLKLTPGKAQLEIIVVDSVEKPSEN